MHLLLMQFFNRNCKKIPDHQNISKPLTKFMVVILQPGCSGNRTSNDMKELPDLGSKEPNHGHFSKGRFLISKSLAISFYVLVYIFSDRFFECLFLHICILGSCKHFLQYVRVLIYLIPSLKDSVVIVNHWKFSRMFYHHFNFGP